MRRVFTVTITFVLISLHGEAAIAQSPAAVTNSASAHERLVRLAENEVYQTAETHPLLATELGITGHDGELDQPSEVARAAYIAQLRGWKAELETIVREPGETLGLVDADDAKLLRARLDAELDSLLIRQEDRKSFAQPSLDVVGGIFVQFEHLPTESVQGTKPDPADVQHAWSDITARLERSPEYILGGEHLVTQPGHLAGVVGSASLAGVPDFFNGALSDAARSQLGADSAEFARFATARDKALAVMADARSYIDEHVSSWPENYAIGKTAYNAMLRDEMLLPFDTADLERMAQDELAHGWAEEAWLVADAKQEGLSFGPSSGGGMAPSGAALVGYYRARIAELKQFVISHDVVTIPSWLGEMEIVETPAFLRPVSPGASMNPPRLFSSSSTGYYYITPPESLAGAASTLDMNQDFDRDRIWSTAAHEAMPGHFLQLSIAKRHPDFIRRIQSSSVFQEGWAFYGEEMFVRLGLYGNDLDARLFTARWERVRGARAIVDGKLASGEWSIDQAVEFFQAQSSFTHDASVAAVDGIALGPGYVIAYTVGRLQLESLLAEYMQRKGATASLHDFHDRLLSYGSTPFAIVRVELLNDLDKPVASVRADANY